MINLADHAFVVFAADAAVPPPLTLRGAGDVDSYQRPSPFDAAQDQISDDYLEGFAFWGLAYLDAQSWRHYLPHLMSYTVRHPDDPRMVAEALIRSLRPPDRYPPRLATVTASQEQIIAAFLAHVTSEPLLAHLADEARQALAEWWGPAPRSRPTADDIEALRQIPATYRHVTGDGYALDVPETLASSGMRDIPQESRRVETWAGLLCGDAHTVIAVNVTPAIHRSLADTVTFYQSLFRDPIRPRAIDVPGASRAVEVAGPGRGDSPAEPTALTLVTADAGEHVVTLTVRTWPRPDLARAVETIVASFRVQHDT